MYSLRKILYMFPDQQIGFTNVQHHNLFMHSIAHIKSFVGSLMVEQRLLQLHIVITLSIYCHV